MFTCIQTNKRIASIQKKKQVLNFYLNVINIITAECDQPSCLANFFHQNLVKIWSKLIFPIFLMDTPPFFRCFKENMSRNTVGRIADRPDIIFVVDRGLLAKNKQANTVYNIYICNLFAIILSNNICTSQCINGSSILATYLINGAYFLCGV